MRPLLTIVTRTFGARPTLYKKHQESIRSQTCQDYEILTITNSRSGVFQANQSLYAFRKRITGNYVHILDDDDRYIDESVIEEFKQIITTNPGLEVVLCRMQRPDRIVPDDRHWGRRPVGGHIGSPCFFVRRDLYQKYIIHFGRPTRGDFAFINAMWPHLTKVYWWNRIVADIMVVSHGAAEVISE